MPDVRPTPLSWGGGWLCAALCASVSLWFLSVVRSGRLALDVEGRGAGRPSTALRPGDLDLTNGRATLVVNRAERCMPMRQLAAVLFVVSVALSAAASPQEGGWCGPWQWLDGRPGADTWNDAASWGSLIVAVGDRGAIALSADGVTWRRVESPVTTDLYAVSWGPRGLVAVGFAGVVLTSRDALHWVRRPTPTNLPLLGVADNGTEYLVVGHMDTVLASRDGTVWSSGPGRRTTSSRWRGATGCGWVSAIGGAPTRTTSTG